MQYAHTMQMNSLSQLFITSQVTPPMLGVPWAPTYPYTAQLASHAAWPAVTMLQSGSNIAGDNSRAANSPITRPLTPPFAPPSHCQPVLLPSHPSHPQPAEGLSPGAPSKVSVLALRADENVEFEASDLSRLDTPTISFADRLDSLFTEWYTGSAAYVSVKGKPVPICQWDRLYKRSQGCEQEKIWRSNGPQWGQWKSIMQEYEVLGKDQKIFWSKYSKADGTRLHYSAIVDRLRDGRSAMDERDADNARRFFNGNLEHPDAHNAFVYRKSGKRYIKKKASIVASAWRNLLAANEDVRSRWEASQGQAHS
ncbi:hypothetical protein OF83DRAFT_1109649 [Amylostereum chailletii]|nr:hypothetical protein OF83DRAFT_1109649 [Amylostereum chailletii]